MIALVQPNQQSKSADRAAAQKYEISKNVAPLGTAPKSKYSDPKSYRNEWRAEQDLKAQRDMSKWAFATMLATIAGVVLIAATLRYTAQAAFAASEAAVHAESIVQVTDRMARQQLRAYLSTEFMEFQQVAPGEAPVAVIRVRNAGQTPALNVVHIATIYRDVWPMTPDEVIVDLSAFDAPPSKGLIGPQIHTLFATRDPLVLTAEDIKTIRSRRMAIYVRIEITWDDIFNLANKVVITYMLNADSLTDEALTAKAVRGMVAPYGNTYAYGD